MPIYFTLSIYRVLLSGGVRAEHSKPYSKRGALLYCVLISPLLGNWPAANKNPCQARKGQQNDRSVALRPLALSKSKDLGRHPKHSSTSVMLRFREGRGSDRPKRILDNSRIAAPLMPAPYSCPKTFDL